MMNNRQKNVLDSDHIGRLLLKLSAPAFLGMFVMTLYNVVDTIFIGHYVGPLGIAGLSIVFPIQMLSMGIGQMTGMGGASVISRLIGSNNISKAEHALGNAVTTCVGLSVLIMITGLSGIDFWLRLIGASETIFPYSKDYLSILLYGMVFMTFAMSMNGLIRAEGNAHVPMTGMIIGAGLNIIFDAIFIISLGMGVQGAALATIIGQSISVIYFLSYYLSGKSFLKLRRNNLILEWNILKDILAIGIASFARTITGSISAIFMNRMLVSYGGDFAVSAFGIINRIMMFAMMPAIVTGQGLQPILGFNYGAKRYDRGLKVIKLALIVSTTWGIIAFSVLYFIPGPLIGLFSTDSELISLGTYAAKRIFLVIYLIGFMMVGSLVFQSLGKAAKSFLTSVARALFVIPLVFILPHFLELEGVWLSFPISDALTFLMTLVFFIPEVRKLRKLNKQQKLPISYPG